MENKIICPNCSSEISVEEALSSRYKDHYEQKFKKQLADQQKQIAEKANELYSEKMKSVKEELNDKYLNQIKLLQADNEKKKSENQQLKGKEIELLKKEQELKEEREEMNLKLQKEVMKKRDEFKALGLKEAESKFELEKLEMQKQIEDQKKLAAEMKRKMEQGSMQMQGEVQELAIEEWLRDHFPLDTIDEVKKGARGADCIQIVNTRSAVACGKICYESKRTKDFHPSWIEKFKADIRDKEGDIGVLVTEVLPADMERMGLKDGIWICTYEEFKGLAAVLRETIIRVNLTQASQVNKGDKMNLLYNYLTGNAFKMQVEAIVEGFSQMKQDLESEKRSLQRIWKQREKQIDKVITNTVEMYGSIKGIAGNAIQSVSALELDSSTFDDEDLEDND